MMIALAAVMMFASPSAVALPCGASIQEAVDQESKPLIRLADHCTYNETVRINNGRAVAIIGHDDTRLNGRISLNGAGPVTVSNLKITAESVAISVRRSGPVTLDNVTLKGRDPLHVGESGPVMVHRSNIIGTSNGVWIEGAESLRILDSRIDGGEMALVLLDVKGTAQVSRSYLHAAPAGDASAAVYVSIPGRVEFTNNRVEYMARPSKDLRAVIDINADGVVADNTLVGAAGFGLRTRQSLIVGCNSFHGILRRVEGPHERMCARDLAPNRLDWRHRVGATAQR